MVVLDLFSGAGGLTEGFYENGAEFVGHIESDRYACETLKTRQAYWLLRKAGKTDLYHKYLLKEISRENLWEKTGVQKANEVFNEFIGEDTVDKLKKKIASNIKKKNISSIDAIIGGPPCQAYSLVGRARMGAKVQNDPRNYLFRYYVEFLREFQPKMFVFENVPGLKTAGNGKYLKDLVSAVEDAGFHMEIKELTASDFGVLQRRKRIIIFGWNKKFFSEYRYPEFEKIVFEDARVGSLLEDLPSVAPGSKVEGKGKYVSEPNRYLVWSGIREKDFDILTQHITRPVNDNDKEIYRLAVEKWFKERKNLRYDQLAEERPDLIKHKNTKIFVDRFNVVKPDETYTHTLVAHIAMDGHYYIHPDIKQNRSISVREAARIQSFPDNFYFEGPRTSVFRQIGNAVPPLMAKFIAREIKKQLDTISC